MEVTMDKTSNDSTHDRLRAKGSEMFDDFDYKHFIRAIRNGFRKHGEHNNFDFPGKMPRKNSYSIDDPVRLHFENSHLSVMIAFYALGIERKKCHFWYEQILLNLFMSLFTICKCFYQC